MHPTLLPRAPRARADPLGDHPRPGEDGRDPVPDRRPDRRHRRRSSASVEVPIAPDETATTLYERVNDAHVELRPPLRAGADRRHRVARCRRTAPGERLAEAHAGRRDRRLGDARAVPRRLGARPDAALPGRVHVRRRGTGRALARRVPSRTPVAGSAGPVIGHVEDGVVVRCGDGALLVQEAEIGGEVLAGAARRRPAAAWGRCWDEGARGSGPPRRRGARHGRHDRPPHRRVGRRGADRVRDGRLVHAVPRRRRAARREGGRGSPRRGRCSA